MIRRRLRPLYDGHGTVNPLNQRESGILAGQEAPKTLTPRRSPPIRPRFPEMDVILDPRAAPLREKSRGWKRISDMSRRCELTAKGPQVGHKVSHSNIKTKRRFLPNLCNVTFISDALGRNVRLRVSTNAIKSVDHRGGFDAFMLKAKATELSPRALDLKRAIEKKVGKPVPVIEGELRA